MVNFDTTNVFIFIDLSSNYLKVLYLNCDKSIDSQNLSTFL